MQADYLLKIIRGQPFVPFSLHLDDGTSFGIRHPDQILVLQRTAIIGIPGRNGNEGFQSFVHCALMHVTRLEMEREPIEGP